MLDLAADRLEVPNLVTGHCTYVGAVEHDDGPVFIRCCGLVRRVPDSRDLRSGLPAGRLDPQGDRVSAVAHALLVCTRDRQQAVQSPRRVPNEVCAPNSACTRSSPGVHRVVNSAQTGENVLASTMGADGPQRHTLNRGASTSTVPNSVCSQRGRRSLSGCSTPHCRQTRQWAAYSAT